MAERCFKKKGSDPPVSGVHKGRLIESRVPIDANAPYLGEITYLMCPVSKGVTLDEK